MSDMLNDAIVDAEALKVAALKNAEALFLEKHSSEIKEAVEMLLEKDDLDMLGLTGGGATDDGLDVGPRTDVSDEEEATLSDIPYVGSHNLDTVPGVAEEDEEITIHLDISDLASELRDDPEIPSEGEEELGGDVNLDLLGDLESLESEPASPEPEMEINESLLQGILEELEFDYESKPQGFAPRGAMPTKELERKLELLDSIEELEAENGKVKDENENLKESLDILERILEDQKNKTKKYAQGISDLEQKLNEVMLSNARLLYTNKALNSISLNERQKQKVVESISRASTVEETKVIFETLESTVGALSVGRRTPKSLSEVVSRNSSPFYSQRKESKSMEDSFAERMREIAGIKKS
ncbi:hypothetical protein OAT10_00405 [Luminiphilus sp.]|nr:hypothetical protein [Luminiphilus sp.]